MAIHNSKLIFVLNDDTRGMLLRYTPLEEDRNAKCSVAKTLDTSIEKGDLVIVASDTRYGFTVSKVEEADYEVDIEAHENVQWIVGKVDLTAHEDLIAQEEVGIAQVKSAEKARKKRELRDAIFANQEEKFAGLSIANYEDGEKKPTPS